MREIDLIQQIAADIGDLGFNVTVDPSSVPNRRMWRYDPPSLWRGIKYRPDLIVDDGENFAIVEIKARPFLFAGVVQARNYAGYFGAPVILCVPDEIFPDIPSSVMKFAGEENIQVCPVSNLPSALSTQLTTPLLRISSQP